MKLIIKKKTSITVHITCCTKCLIFMITRLGYKEDFCFLFFVFFFFFEEDFKEEIKERKRFMTILLVWPNTGN